MHKYWLNLMVYVVGLLVLGVRAQTTGSVRFESSSVSESVSSASKTDSGRMERSTEIELLRRLAEEQVAVDGTFLGKIRFRVDEKQRTLSYDLDPVPLTSVLSPADPYALSLESFIRLTALRRDFGRNVQNDQFWKPGVESIERAVERCVTRVGPAQTRQSLTNNELKCSKEIDEQFAILRTSIVQYSAAHKFAVRQPPQVRDAVPGYRVTINIDPPLARVKIMTLLEYKKYRYFKTPEEQYEWEDLVAREADMIGWYHYRAEWPAALNGPEEGNFEIKKPGAITFRPTQQ